MVLRLEGGFMPSHSVTLMSTLDGEVPLDSLKSLLEDLHVPDLTGKLIDVSTYMVAHGGYSDVYCGNSMQHRGMKVAIKRIRVCVLESQKTAKVCLFAYLKSIIVLTRINQAYSARVEGLVVIDPSKCPSIARI